MDENTSGLLEELLKEGVITQDEYDALKKILEESRPEEPGAEDSETVPEAPENESTAADA